MSRGKLIGFLGSPGSGKTTLAASVFASLKDLGYPCEFVPEQARFEIARARMLSQPITDEFQLEILKLQYQVEELMVGSSTLVVTDSCVFNTLLYTELRPNPEFLAPERYQILFRTQALDTPYRGQDGNRIHSLEQAAVVDSKIPDLINDYALTTIPVTGIQKHRHTQALREILGVLTC